MSGPNGRRFPIVAVGCFDGVHLGHQRILEGVTLAVTFANHPRSVLSAAEVPRSVMTLEDRVAAIRACGVGEVRVLDFTSALAALSPEAFLASLGLKIPDFSVRCGANWRFGHRGEGTAEWLRSRGVAVEEVVPVEFGGAAVSSTRIREGLLRGDFAAVNAMLGRPFAVTGTVRSGKGEGRRLGYPTLNLVFDEGSPLSSSDAIPAGVYQVAVEGRKAIANYGFAPTFGDRGWKEPVLEVHLLEEEASAALPTVRVEFVRFVRPERRFATPDELRRQIAADIAGI